eukprot:COSAG05_NODE_2420_length_3085_cov_2.362023_1_plen_344_part_00
MKMKSGEATFFQASTVREFLQHGWMWCCANRSAVSVAKLPANSPPRSQPNWQIESPEEAPPPRLPPHGAVGWSMPSAPPSASKSMLYRRPTSSTRSTSDVSAASSVFSATDEPGLLVPGDGSCSVERWLQQLGMAQYTDGFLLEGWDDLSAVRLMQPEDLPSCGVAKEGHRRRVCAAIEALRSGVGEKPRGGLAGDVLGAMLGTQWQMQPQQQPPPPPPPRATSRRPATPEAPPPPPCYRPGEPEGFETPSQRRARALREQQQSPEQARQQYEYEYGDESQGQGQGQGAIGRQSQEDAFLAGLHSNAHGGGGGGAGGEDCRVMDARHEDRWKSDLLMRATMFS